MNTKLCLPQPNTREMYCLPNLDNGKFEGYYKEEIREVIELDVCKHFMVSMERVNSKSRKRKYVNARQIIMALLIHYSKYTIRQIGDAYGHRDHTTAMHARDTIKDCLTQKAFTPEKQLLNAFLYCYGYKSIEQKAQQQKAFVIDAHY